MAKLIGETLEHLDADLPPAGIKIGMLGSVEAVLAVAGYLRKVRGRGIPVVLDPVIRSSSGAALLDQEGLAAMQQELLPLVDWITPNQAELAILSGAAGGVEDGLRAFARLHPHIHAVATGGDCEGDSTVDVLLAPDGGLHRFEGERVATTSTHGTGCAFSSALLARLVLGDAPVEAVGAAKAYVTEALRQAPGLGGGNGPLNLLWPLHRR